MADENNAASSTAAEVTDKTVAAIEAQDFAAYQAEENARELAARNGTATKEEPPPSTEPSDQTVPVTETGKPATQEKKPKTGEERKAELKAEIDELLRKRAELQGKIPETKPGEKKAADPPAAETGKTAKKAEAPVEPKLDDFATYAEYQAADRKYIRELVKFEAEQVVQDHQVSASVQAQNKVIEDALEARKAEAREMFADFDEVALDPGTPISKAMDGWILKNIKAAGAFGMHVLYRLGENRGAEAKRIHALDAYDQVEELNKLRDSFKTPPAKTNTAGKAHTSAPPPATEVNGRTSTSSDPVMAALKSGDVEAYMREANAREAKARRN